MKEGISNMHPIFNLSYHHLLPLAVYDFGFGLEYLVKYGMCLLQSDTHWWTLNGAKVIFHFVLEPQLSCLRLYASVTVSCAFVLLTVV